MTASKLLFMAALLVGLAPSYAQLQPFTGTPEVEHSLRRLDQLGSVLMIAAHPDDERTGVLAYFARGRHMRTAYLSVTRGEGGQNLIGAEQGAELGVIRTQELLAARKIDGAEQFFTRAIDFGFTKTASETFEKWGHDRILSDIVWVIRSYRPDVIVLVFSGTPNDGHGQHQVSGILGKEAFTAAADPAKYPEQLKYAAPWQAARLVRAGGFGGRGGGGGAGAAAGEVDTGAFDPMLGYSYEELATLSRSMHHSQGTGAMRRPGGNPTSFSLVAGSAAPSAKDLFDGIDTTWNRLPGGAAIGPVLERAIGEFEPAHPEKAIPALAQARPLIAAISDPLARIKLAELDETMARCAGIWAEAQSRAAEAAPGATLDVTTTVMNRSQTAVSLDGARIEGIWNEALEVKPAALGYNRSATVEFSRQVPSGQAYSQPYWLVKPAAGDVYTVDDQRLVGLADTPPVLQVRLKLTIGGAAVEIVRPVHQRYASRAEGERTRPLVVVPVVAVNPPARVAVFPGAAARAVHVSVAANVADAAGELRLEMPDGWKAEPRKQAFRIANVGERRDLVFTVTPPAGAATATLRAVAEVGGREISSGMEVISYPHIPPQTMFPEAAVKLVRADVRVTARKVGYIMGAGDEMPEALGQLGVEVTLLDEAGLAQGDLGRFDAIVAGVRAYNVRADLRATQARLLEYVKNGGTYLVQYQTGDGSLDVGPYPMTIPAGSRYRVTVEEAPVEFPHPASPLLRVPNPIDPAKDFEGWIQERGLYFASKWDPKYETVLSSHDPGEDALEGGELWTRYGKGVYIFTSYAWFRQLPGGVAGAYRLFANLLSAK